MMSTRTATTLKPLPPGLYRLRCKDRTALIAAKNGHGRVWPEADAVSKDGWVTFVRGREQLFYCNAAYAASHVQVVTRQTGDVSAEPARPDESAGT